MNRNKKERKPTQQYRECSGNSKSKRRNWRSGSEPWTSFHYTRANNPNNSGVH
uniref:Uncharacterized protein n=1 Tax=Arundo donax TaxID=35708 RepID=A0A0A9G4B1_ARUDO